MSKFFKRIFPVFLSFALFITTILLCCLKNADNDSNINKPPDIITETNDEILFTPPKISNKTHVFHKDEMRGVWVPYFNLSNGSTPMSEDEFKSHFDNIIKTAKNNGINTLFVHVRSHCDAVYPSEIFPFSDIFTGNSEVAPDYDPLEYMISASHKAGLEFHAWLNPFRVISDTEKKSLGENSPCYKWLHDDNPDNDRNLIEYNGGLYLNPSQPEARSLIINGVRELVNNYDVDGVHLDDYFYMFTELEYDAEDYANYVENIDNGFEPLPLMQWRCTNINVLVSGIYAVIKNIDENILFGISPQGNMENDLEMGADVYSWCSRYGYVDYIAPQIYYNSDNPSLPFEETVDNWKNIITNDKIKLYVGLALYKAGSDDDEGTWQTSDDIIQTQIEYTRSADTDGFILYSWEFLENEQTQNEMDNVRDIM